MHILDDGRTASRLLLQRLIDFRFAPLIAVQYTFCDFPSLCITHKSLSVVKRCPTYINLHVVCEN